MSRIRSLLIGAAAATAAVVLASAPAYADPGGGSEGGIEAISINIAAACDGETQGVQVDAQFALTGTSVAGVLIDGSSQYEEPLDSGQSGQDGISTFIALEDGTYSVAVYAASVENVYQTVNVTLPDGEGCEAPEVVPPSIESITASSLGCIKGAPNAVVNVNVVLPEGNAPASLDVTYGEDVKLSGTQTVHASGQFSFTGPVPVGEVEFAIVLNGLYAGSALVVTEECTTDGGTNPPVTPPTTNPPANNPPASNPPAAQPQQPAAPSVPGTNNVRPGATGDIVKGLKGATVETTEAASVSSQIQSSASRALTVVLFGALGAAVALGIAAVVVRRRLASNR